MKYSKKELYEIWEKTIGLLLENDNDFIKEKLYENSFLFEDHRGNFNIIFTTGQALISLGEEYRKYSQIIKEALSSVMGHPVKKIIFQRIQTITPSQVDKYDMLDERLDRIEELLLKNQR